MNDAVNHPSHYTSGPEHAAGKPRPKPRHVPAVTIDGARYCRTCHPGRYVLYAEWPCPNDEHLQHQIDATERPTKEKP